MKHGINMIMRFLLYVLMISSPTLAYSQKLIINGTAPMLKDSTIISIEQVVPRRLSRSIKPQTTLIKDHCFVFNLKAKNAELYFISINGHNIRAFLEPGKASIFIADSVLRNVSVTKNHTSLEYDQYYSEITDIKLATEYTNARLDYADYSHNHHIDTILMEIKIRKMDSLYLVVHKKDLANSLKWIKKHPNSYLNTYILYNQIEYMAEAESKKIFQSMPLSITNNIWGRELKYRIDSLFIGATAPAFSEADINGRQVSLASFRGKYVLIDFWASWCIPCREENPSITKAMEKFKDQNFTILGISLDDERSKWVKAIKQDDLKWTQLSNLKLWDDGASKKYYVYAIPDNYLIDPEGKIVAKNLHGIELVKTLNKLFNNK